MEIEFKDTWEYRDLDEEQVNIGQLGVEDPLYSSPMRGQSNFNWTLSTGLFRNRKSKTMFCKDYFGRFWDNNTPPTILGLVTWVKDTDEALYNAIAAFPQLATCAIFQHDGNFRTPLLDVSLKIYAPFYFACKDDIDKDGALYRFEIIKEKRSVFGFRERFTSLLNFGRLPTAFNRMKLQNGLFLYTMSAEDSIRRDVGHHISFCDISVSENIKVMKYKIPKELKPKILEDLKIKFKTNDLDVHFGLKPKT